MSIDPLPGYNAVELGLCVPCRLAKRIEDPRETASKRMAIYLRRVVDVPGMEVEQSVSHLHLNI